MLILVIIQFFIKKGFFMKTFKNVLAIAALFTMFAMDAKKPTTTTTTPFSTSHPLFNQLFDQLGDIIEVIAQASQNPIDDYIKSVESSDLDDYAKVMIFKRGVEYMDLLVYAIDLKRKDFNRAIAARQEAIDQKPGYSKQYRKPQPTPSHQSPKGPRTYKK